MKLLNKSEALFYKHLINAGFEPDKIKNPENDNTVQGNADFLIDDIAIEIKSPEPNVTQRSSIEELTTALKNGEVATYWVPSIKGKFLDYVNTARRQLKPYLGCSKYLAIDETNYGLIGFDKDELIKGRQKLTLDNINSIEHGVEWTDKLFHFNKNTTFSGIIFFHEYGMDIFHNLMSPELSIMTVGLMEQFFRSKISVKQFLFLNHKDLSFAKEIW